MRYLAWCAGLIGLALLVIAPMGSAQAQATRTWVSGVGDDANPCSRTAPCKTFAGAISKTATGGEISVLDPGGFGAVTITKSISLVNDSSGEAGILASGTNGITINAAGAVVYLRGLVVDGAPPGSPGLNGVRFIDGAALYVDNCVIKNFTSANGSGINFAPSAGGQLFVSNTSIYNNGTGASTAGGGVYVQPTGAGTVGVALKNVQMVNNSRGFEADTTAVGSAPIAATISDSMVAGNFNAGIVAYSAGSGVASTIMLSNVVVANNSKGVVLNGSAATVRIGSSTVTGNTNGILVSGGATIQSYKNNQINGNASDGTPLVQSPGGFAPAGLN